MSLKNYSNEELKAEIERRNRPTPEIIGFKWYLHESYTRGEIMEEFERKTGVSIELDLAENIYNKFYEVGFNCTLNTKTGNVKILGILNE